MFNRYLPSYIANDDWSHTKLVSDVFTNMTAPAVDVEVTTARMIKPAETTAYVYPP